MVIGRSIRYGHSILRWIAVKKHTAALNKLPRAFYSVNLVARKPEKTYTADQQLHAQVLLNSQ